MVMCPRFDPSGMSSLFCVFDGTCGDHASEFAQKKFMHYLMQHADFVKLIQTITETHHQDEVLETITHAFRNAFINTDAALLEQCREHQHHYTASTGVTAFFFQNLLSVAHVGDSRACIARVSSEGGSLECEMLTVSHKANTPQELQRIESQGGSLVYLHGDKPYVRGGDFHARQKTGERPKQLNYSRAFGGKDLKMFGLSAEPDITHLEVKSCDRLVLIGSDGLFDVMTAFEASFIAIEAFKAGLSPCQEVINRAINQMPRFNVRDNITVVAIFLNTDSNFDGNFGARSNTQTPVQFSYSSASSLSSESVAGTQIDPPPAGEEHVFRI